MLQRGEWEGARIEHCRCPQYLGEIFYVDDGIRYMGDTLSGREVKPHEPNWTLMNVTRESPSVRVPA
jgi:hypothetical protein